MSKFTCHCGVIYSDIDDRKAEESTVVEEGRLDEIVERVSKTTGEISSVFQSSPKEKAALLRFLFSDEYPRDVSVETAVFDLLTNAITLNCRSMLVCPSCERLYIQEEIGSSKYICYVKQIRHRSENARKRVKQQAKSPRSEEH